MSLDAARDAAVAALRTLAEAAAAEARANPAAFSRARALQDLAHRSAGAILPHGDRA